MDNRKICNYPSWVVVTEISEEFYLETPPGLAKKLLTRQVLWRLGKRNQNDGQFRVYCRLPIA
jgi:hypothetical protein